MSRKTRKLIWSAPLVAVLAVAGALAMFVALAPNGAEADHVDLLGSVTDLEADVLGRAEIELSWKNPSGDVESYRIDTSSDTYVWESKEMSTTNVTMDSDGVVTYTDTEELAAGDPRFYRVFAMNAAGTGLAPLDDYVRANGIANTVPGTKQDLVATAASSTQINLTWGTPEDTGHTDITRYCISVSRPGTAFDPLTETNCGSATAITSTTSSPSLSEIAASLVATTVVAGTIVVEADGSGQQSYEHTGLQSRTPYRYRVTAFNSVGRATTGSNIANATTLAPASGDTTAPDAVRNLRAVVTSTGDTPSVNLYWNLPADVSRDADDFEAPDYEVDAIAAASRPADDDTNWATLGSTGGASDAHEWSGTVPARTTGQKVFIRVRVGEDGTPTVITLPDNAFVAAGTTLTDVQPALPARDGTPAPAIASAGGSLTQITLRWDRAAQGVTRPTGYELDFVVGDGEVGTTDSPEIADEQQHWISVLPESRSGYARSPVNHRDLTPGTEYVYRIFPYKDGVYGPPVVVNAETAPAVAPDTRLNLRVIAEGPTKLKLTWDEPSSDGGSDVTGYFIQVANDTDDNRTLTIADANPWISINDFGDTNLTTAVMTADGAQEAWETDDPDTREYVYEGLSPEQARWFRVIALNGVATVTASGVDDAVDTVSNEATDALGSSVPARGQTARASVPMAPNGLVAETARNSNLTGAGNRGVLLLWNAPDDPTGDALDGYMIARKVDDGEWDEEWREIREDNPRTYATDSAIPADGEMRYYRVAAFNGAGTSPYTDPVRYPADTTHNNDPMIGAAIADATVEVDGTVTVDISNAFSDADGDDLYHDISISPPQGVATFAVDDRMDTTLEITGVAVGTATITVNATDGMGGDFAMQDFDVMVIDPAPMMLTRPEGVEASVLNGSISVIWTPDTGGNATQIKVVLFNEDVTDVVTVQTFNPAVNEPGAYTFNNVMPGTYSVGVAAYNSDEGHMTSLAPMTFTVQ